MGLNFWGEQLDRLGHFVETGACEMAKFSVGQRVRVPSINQTAPTNLKGQEGIVTLVAPHIQSPAEDDRPEVRMLTEQQYEVLFDAFNLGEQVVFESQLDAV